VADEIRASDAAVATMTITLASLTNGSIRQSDMVNNDQDRPAAIIFVQIKSGGSAPTAGTVYEVYLLRGNKHTPDSPTHRTDGAGPTDAAMAAIVNAIQLGVIVLTASSNTLFYGEFDTGWIGPLGPEWGIAIKNSSGQTLNSSGHLVGYTYITPEIQ